MKSRTKWENENIKINFQSGVYVYNGFNALMLSHFPERVMKFLSWIGFECDQQKAIDKIDTAYRLNSGMFGLQAAITTGIYECVVVPVFGARQPDCQKIFAIVDKELEVYPQSSWALMFKALALKLNGDIDNAIDYYNRCIDSQKDLLQLHNICYWDLSFCHGLV